MSSVTSDMCTRGEFICFTCVHAPSSTATFFTCMLHLATCYIFTSCLLHLASMLHLGWTLHGNMAPAMPVAWTPYVKDVCQTVGRPAVYSCWCHGCHTSMFQALVVKYAWHTLCCICRIGSVPQGGVSALLRSCAFKYRYILYRSTQVRVTTPCSPTAVPFFLVLNAGIAAHITGCHKLRGAAPRWASGDQASH
jgi:hypothetical protein